MSQHTNKEFRGISHSDNSRKVRGILNRCISYQAAAATAAGVAMTPGMALDKGTVREIFAVIDTAFGAAETLTVDVLVNGVSILAAPVVLDVNTAVGVQVPIAVPAGTVLAVGDVLTVSRTLASTDQTPANTIGLEYS